MGIYHGKNARLLIGGYDISALALGVTPVQEREMKPYAILDGVNGYHQMPGLFKDILSINGLFDDTYMIVLTALWGSSTGYQVIVPLGGSTLGTRCLAVNAARLQKYASNTVVTDISKLSADLIAENLMWEETRLLEWATRTVTDAEAAIDDAAASIDGGAAYLQAYDIGVDDTIGVTLQHSSNAIDFVDIAGLNFTVIDGSVSTRGTERKVFSGLDSGSDLTEDLDATETGIDVTNGTHFTNGQTIKIDNEKMLISNIVANTLTVTRGYDGTTAAIHTITTSIYIWDIQRYIRARWYFGGTTPYTATIIVVWKRY